MRGREIITSVVVAIFASYAILPAVSAQEGVLHLPAVGQMIAPTGPFIPAMIKGIKIFPDNPLKFDFIIDTGSGDLGEVPQDSESYREESEKLIKYFLSSLTVPEKDMWVNLSPHEPDRIIPKSFGITGMGRDLLSQDYILKQLTASLLYPEENIGEKFWERIYQKSQEMYGIKDIPINAVSKVWIVPEKAVVYENAKNNTVFVVESKLKVMLEEDYDSFRQKGVIKNSEENIVASGIIKEIILPAIEREVNEGKNFSQLRQIYHAMILATWFKQNLKESFLGNIYLDKNKIEGVEVEDKDIKNKIYSQYLEAFKEGVFNYIKEEYDPIRQKIISRKYFSGGIATNLGSAQILETMEKESVDEAMVSKIFRSAVGILTVSVMLSCVNPIISNNNANSQRTEIRTELSQKDKIDSLRKSVEKTASRKAKSSKDIDFLIKSAKHPDARIRLNAVKGLGLMKNKSDRVVAALISAFKDVDSKIASYAIYGLMGAEHIDVLILAAKDGSFKIRKGVVFILKKLKNKSEKAVENLLLFANDSNIEIKRYAILGLVNVNIQSEKIIKTFMSASHDSDEQVRLFAFLGLEKVSKKSNKIMKTLFDTLNTLDFAMGKISWEALGLQSIGQKIDFQYNKRLLEVFKSDTRLQMKLNIVQLFFLRSLWDTLKEIKHEMENLYEENPVKARALGVVLAALSAEEKFLSEKFVFKKNNQYPIKTVKGLTNATKDVLLWFRDVALGEKQSKKIFRKMILHIQLKRYTPQGVDSLYRFSEQYLNTIIKRFGKKNASLIVLWIIAHETEHGDLENMGLWHSNLEKKSIHEFIADLAADYWAESVGERKYIAQIHDFIFGRYVDVSASAQVREHAVARTQSHFISEVFKKEKVDIDSRLMWMLSREIVQEQLFQEKKSGKSMKFRVFIRELLARYGREMRKKSLKPHHLFSKSTILWVDAPIHAGPGIVPYQQDQLRFFLSGQKNTLQKGKNFQKKKKNSNADQAIFSEKSITKEKHTKGGIDLNMRQMHIEHKGEKIKDFKFPFAAAGIPCIDEDGDGICDAIDREALKNLNISGFSPIILQIVPVSIINVPFLLGLGDEDEYFKDLYEEIFDLTQIFQ